MQQRHEPAIDRAGALQLPVADGFTECQRLDGEGVGQPRHPAPRSEHQALEGEIIEPREEHVAIAQGIEHIREAPRIGCGLLERHDVRLLRQLLETFHLDVDPICRWIVVQHDRQRGRLRHGAQVILELGARRHVYHRRQHHQAVDADALGIARVGHRAARRQLRDTGDERHLAPDCADGRRENRALLLCGEGVVFPHGAQQHQAVNAVAHQGRQHCAGRLQIDREIGAELCGSRRKDSGPGAFERRGQADTPL